MGWTFTFRPSGQSTRDFFASEFSGETGEVLDVAAPKSGEVYVAYRQKGGKVLCIACLTKGKSGSQFGYKDMSESMGPHMYHCPKRVLDKLSPAAEIFTGKALEYALSWRSQQPHPRYD